MHTILVVKVYNKDTVNTRYIIRKVIWTSAKQRIGAFKVVLISYLLVTYLATYSVTYLIRRMRSKAISNEIKGNGLDCPLFLFAHLFVTYHVTYS